MINDFLYRLLKNKQYNTYSGGMVQISCSEASLYEDVYLMIGGYWIQISASDYILNLSGTCLLAFVPIEAGYWLAGIPLFSGYYTIHDNNDQTRAKMGFAPHATS